MFVSILTALTAVHVGSVIIAASVFSDFLTGPLPDQTSWPWSGPEIKHTNESNKWNLSVRMPLWLLALSDVNGFEWTQICRRTRKGKWQQLTAEMLCTDWMWQFDTEERQSKFRVMMTPQCKSSRLSLPWRLRLRVVLQNEIMRRDEEMYSLYLLTTVSSLLITLR